MTGTPMLGWRDMRLWATFNEGSPATVRDYSLYNHHGTIYGATRTSGRFGGGMYLDGIDDYIDFGVRPGLKSTQVTFAIWIAFPDVDVSSNDILGDSPTAGKYNIVLRFHKGDLKLVAYNNTFDYITANNVITENDSWYFVVVTAKKGGEMKIYVNGEEKASGTASDYFYTDGHLIVGNIRPTASNWLWAYVDELMMFSRILSPYEINLLYQNRLGVVPSKTI